MGRDAQLVSRLRRRRPERLDHPGIAVDVLNEPPLSVSRGQTAKIRVGVEHRQMCQLQPRRLRRSENRQRQFLAPRIGRAVQIVVQIVELGDPRIASLQERQVQPRRNRLYVLGRQGQRKEIHDVAPRPEAVHRIAAHFGQASHRILKRVAVQIGDARHNRRIEDRQAIRIVIGHQCRNRAIGCKPRRQVAPPAVRRQGEAKVCAVHLHPAHFCIPSGWNSTIASTSPFSAVFKRSAFSAT